MEIKGLTIKEIMNIDVDDLMKLSRSELSKVTSRLVSASNKRIRRLEKTEVGRSSPAYISVSKNTGAQFSVKGKNVNQLRNEFKLAKNFLNFKTSTLTGWKNVRDRIEKEIGGFDTPAQSKKFWKTYRELEERHGGFIDKEHGNTRMTSDRIQKLLHEEMSSSGFRKSRKSIIKNMEKKLDRIYELEQSEFADELFEMDEEDEFDY